MHPPHPTRHTHHTLHALNAASGQLLRQALKLLGYVVLAFLVLKLIPSLKQALTDLEHVSGLWIVGAVALEVVSEMGYVQPQLLNTAVDALTMTVFGVLLAVGIFAGTGDLLLTLLPAAVGAGGIAAALWIAHRAEAHSTRLEGRHPKVAAAIIRYPRTGSS